MHFDNIIRLGCSFTQMKMFIGMMRQIVLIVKNMQIPDWTERLQEYFGVNVINAGNSGHSNYQMELQYLKAKAKLNPNDKNLVIGGLTHTGRLWTRGYAGMSHSGETLGEDVLGTINGRNL